MMASTESLMLWIAWNVSISLVEFDNPNMSLLLLSVLSFFKYYLIMNLLVIISASSIFFFHLSLSNIRTWTHLEIPWRLFYLPQSVNCKFYMPFPYLFQKGHHNIYDHNVLNMFLNCLSTRELKYGYEIPQKFVIVIYLRKFLYPYPRCSKSNNLNTRIPAKRHCTTDGSMIWRLVYLGQSAVVTSRVRHCIAITIIVV